MREVWEAIRNNKIFALIVLALLAVAAAFYLKNGSSASYDSATPAEGEVRC